jgi:peptidoglycan/xylan/chitin deacetylase (PgdA/CDA1 family)
MIAFVARRVRALCNRARAGCLVLCYHRVSEITADAWGNAVSPANFDKHIALLAKRYAILTIDELVDAVERGRAPSRRAMAITFDDGYKVNVGPASDTLVRHQAPATFYLNTAWLDGGAFWWDEIAALTAHQPDAPSVRERLRDVCKAMTHGERHELLRRMREEAAISEPGAPHCAPMTRRDVTQLANNPLFTVAAHTHSHPALWRVTAERQRDEIRESKRILEEITGRPVTHFSYPFGSSHDFDASTIAAIADAGLRSAATTSSRPVRWPADRYRLPRLSVKNWDEHRFQAQIEDAWSA